LSSDHVSVQSLSVRKSSGQSLKTVVVSSALDLNNLTSDRRTQSDDASSEDSADDEKDEENGRELLMLTSSSTMASSLERSLEQGAMHSDGLSDKERRVQAVKNTIRGHRRTQSNPQAAMSIVDETSYETDSDDAVRI
uniref:Osteopontin n=1 Tax=Angiostrongylus costaricensis TaxID=334426 RepID=A0A0R3PLB5_ANGCS